MKIRTYEELAKFETFEERFKYLQVSSVVGGRTFGGERYLNQKFYTSYEWRRARTDVIARDLGCDLGLPGYEIYDRVYIHHMNPITPDQIKLGSLDIVNPRYLITVTHRTHNAIHYGDLDGALNLPVERQKGDTKLW